MNKRLPLLLGFLLLCVLVSSCSSALRSESGLYDVTLHRSLVSGVDGGWLPQQRLQPTTPEKGRIFIAPVRTTSIAESPYAAKLAEDLHRYTCEYLEAALQEANAANHSDWHITPDKEQADYRIDMAIVRFHRQYAATRAAAHVFGWFSPIPGVSSVAEWLAKGSITLELTIRNARTGNLLLAAKDTNPTDARLYSTKTYSATGQAEANLRYWAQELAQLCRDSAADRLGERSLREMLHERGLRGAWRARREARQRGKRVDQTPALQSPAPAVE
ncbi:MAG: DUF3313 family protein [Akkermansia sp.]